MPRALNDARIARIARAERRAQRVSAIAWFVVDVAVGVWLVLIAQCAA